MKLVSFIKPFNNPYVKKRILKNTIKAVNPITGFDIGIPLNIFSNVYTNLHYGYDITTARVVLLQFLFGYYAYGKDRYRDALDYYDKPYETSKKELYENFIKYRNIYSISFELTIYLINILLLTDKHFEYNIPFIFLIYSTGIYKEIKKTIGVFKPAYIAIMWTLAAVVLPCVLHDDNYSIFYYPIDYVPPALILFASSNIADAKDVEEDKVNKIDTIPVRIGKDKSNMVSLFALSIASLMIGLNPHYLDRPLINSVIEIQNAGISVLPLLMTNITLFNNTILEKIE
tara:strand:+ start:1744 stop:2604 length:861 start_codon:yes stop_codon:yes gene_type:complete